MKIEFIKDPTQTECKLALIAAEETPETHEILRELERLYSEEINGWRGECVELLRQSEVLRVYAEGQHVWAQTEKGIYLLRARLYEMEARLDPKRFVRISKCEIVNLNRILRLDVSLSGSIGVILEGDVKTYTSRRYMKKLKDALGV
ncbi:MAG: LytTR family transcriptional regulator [Clostridia bacterium]|nr:LytTR family transcriptional regulator [Clostridia bacterium]